MKTVKIPTHMNPFVCILNGEEYTFEAGATVEVSDELAAVIEKSEFRPPVAPIVPSSGGVSSWNDLTDKPFGESATGGDTLVWDGNTEGLAFTVVDDEFALYKVCDVVPSVEDVMKGGLISISAPMGSATYPAEVYEMGHGAWGTNAFFGVPESAVGIALDGIVFSESGVYAAHAGSGTTISLQINGYTGFPTLKKMDSKYMPDPIIFYIDDDKYLYETPDTSDPANRVTMQRLKKIAVMPCRKYFYGVNGSMSWYMDVCGFQFSESYGMVIALEITAYTAEYEPK